jgi:putative transposase
MLVSEYDFLAIEDLNVKGMSAKGKGSRKRGLNRGIRSNLLGQFRVMLEYKADWYGKQVVAINRWFPSSKTCHKCQHVNRDLKLSDREWDCPGCGAHLDRDINAAINILAAGLAVIVCGEASGELTAQRQSRPGVLVEAGRSHP